MKRYFSLILAIAATVSAQIVPSTGNVRGPTSATDNAVARYDGTTGKLIQNSGVTIDDSGNLTVSGTATIGPSADVKLARGPSGAGNLAVTAATDGYCEITARGAAGNLRIFSAYTGVNFNWYWGADASAQTGSNAGSNFVLVAGSDTGGSLGTYLTVNRATAATTLAGNLTVSGGTARFQDPTNSYGVTITTAATKTLVETLFGGSSLGIRVGGSGSDSLTIASTGATIRDNLTVSGGTISSGSGTLTLNSSANTVVLQSAGTTALTLSSTQALRLNAYGAGALTTDSSGNVTATSDERAKNIIGTFTKGLAEVVKLTPKTYTWKPETGLNPTDEVVSLTAQDLIAAGLPEAVSTYRTVADLNDDGTPKLDADGKPLTKRIDATYTVSDRAVIAALVNAVKELKAEVDALKAARK